MYILEFFERVVLQIQELMENQTRVSVRLLPRIDFTARGTADSGRRRGLQAVNATAERAPARLLNVSELRCEILTCLTIMCLRA